MRERGKERERIVKGGGGERCTGVVCGIAIIYTTTYCPTIEFTQRQVLFPAVQL